MSRAEDRGAQTEEAEVAVRATKAAEATARPGIYVYTLPHYLRHPFEPDRAHSAEGWSFQR